ncbi:MAG TPA: HAMP domain-containing sensor histidine kinase [Nevskia sp.]|nr:HAMP domain-containing sensor histidine kinase [Nevskia sp.]
MSPLYRRLLLWFCMANVATMLISVWVTQDLARRTYGGELDWPILAQTADEAYIKGGRQGLADWAELTRREEHFQVRLYEGGVDLLDRPLNPALERHLPQLLASDSIVLRPVPEVLLVGQKVTGSDGVPRQMVALRGPRPPYARLHLLVWMQIILSLLAIMVVGWWVARGIAKPAAALQKAAQRMAAGDLTARVGGTYPQAKDELGLLAREFDHMAERIEALVAHERAVLQDVSHELRSPLARLQLILELARQEGGSAAAHHFSRAEHEISRLDVLIGELLALTRMEADLPGMARETVDLAALAADCLAEAELEADAHGAKLRLDAPQPLEVSGTAQLLARAVDNLLSNAIKFGADGEILLSLRRHGELAELSVRDQGPGVPEAELSKLFRPFFRGANAARAEGHGLGLAIVQRIAQAHGGEVAAENVPGGGLCITLSLPLIVTEGAGTAAA